MLYGPESTAVLQSVCPGELAMLLVTKAFLYPNDKDCLLFAYM
jgi:hypothetical protein